VLRTSSEGLRRYSAKPVTLPEAGKIREAAEVLSRGDFHALPFVSGQKLVAMVTSTDLIKYLCDQF
jgi:CBS domain-containing protein